MFFFFSNGLSSRENPREAALAADLITASLIRLLAVPGQYFALGGRYEMDSGQKWSKNELLSNLLLQAASDCKNEDDLDVR